MPARLGADLAIGIAGVPGPNEIDGKPMGLAYVALASANGEKAMEFRVPPRRVTIKRRMANQALIELRKMVSGSRAT